MTEFNKNEQSKIFNRIEYSNEIEWDTMQYNRMKESKIE